MYCVVPTLTPLSTNLASLKIGESSVNLKALLPGPRQPESATVGSKMKLLEVYWKTSLTGTSTVGTTVVVPGVVAGFTPMIVPL